MPSWYQGIRAKFDRLTPAERDYLYAHPWHADNIEEDSDKALAEAEKRFGGGSLHNGAGDAFRHCYWNALLARDIGKENALTFTTAHEDRPDNPTAEKEMDLHNNRVGAEIGGGKPNSSDNELAVLCQDALSAGKLSIIKP